MKDSFLSIGIFAATALLVTVGTLWPNTAARTYAGVDTGGAPKSSASNPQSAVDELVTQLKTRSFAKAYSTLSNKAEFSEAEFERDMMGSALSLRTYATLDSYEVEPRHQTATEADFVLKTHWSSVVGIFNDARRLHVVKTGDRWAIEWPVQHETRVPPQVLPVNYLRWDVIYSGAGDEWGTEDVESPHVRIVDMHPVNRAEGTVVMGELLNEDVVPAYVNVRATLLRKDGTVLDNEGPFDMISHTLLPKQVTPFIIHFPNIPLSEVGSVRMEPLAVLLSASADPVVEIENQQYKSDDGGAVTGQLRNQSGRAVNVSHVLSTFYDKSGKIVWVGGQYIDRALPTQTPIDFRVPVPHDLASSVGSERTIVASYIQGNTQ